MLTLPTLYPHQEAQRDATRDALRRLGRVILCANPGVGKTRMAKWILGSALNHEPNAKQSGMSLFTVHRRGLVDNATGSFGEDPALPYGVIMSGRETNYLRRLQVASIDTLLSWFCEGGYQSKITFDLVVFDEAHSHIGKLKTFLDAHDARREGLGLNPSIVIGLTATPQAKGLADVFKTIVTGPTTEWLIENNYLSPFRYFRATQGQLDKLVKRAGEFTKDSVSEAMDGLAGDLVRDWKQYANGQATVGFFPRLSHAKEAMQLLLAAGIEAAYVDGSTPDEERRAIFRAVNNGSIQYLCNVGVVERGTDIPRIGCVQLCVAIGSVVRYRQMIGRGSRVHPDVPECLVLDHGGNIKRHGFFEDEIPWTLDITTAPTNEAGTRPTIQCPRCPAIYRGGKCRQCGYEPQARERKSQGLVFDGSELKEITRKERSPSQMKPNEAIMVSALYAAGRSGKTWKQAIGIAKRAAEQRGQKFRVPRVVEVGGRRVEMLPYGHPDASRRVRSLFPWTVRKG